MIVRILALASVASALAGCATQLPPAEPMGGSPVAGAAADVREPGGRSVANATATQVGDGIRIRLDATGMAPGTYAAHIHAIGRCDPPGFESAGGHWNPTGRDHGRDNPAGQHLGDLPNLVVGTAGSGSIEFTITGATLGGAHTRMLDADGAAIVIHASPDDYRTDPSGNSGARIACGVFG